MACVTLSAGCEPIVYGAAVKICNVVLLCNCPDLALVPAAVFAALICRQKPANRFAATSTLHAMCIICQV